MELAYYGNSLRYLQKADANILTTTSGVFNTVFGAYAWANLNLEANIWSVLPKYVWDRSGFRIITAKVGNLAGTNITTLGGTPEEGVIADTAKPTVEEVSVKPKIAQLPFGASVQMEWLANNSKDDIWGSLASLRLFNATQHKELLAQMLFSDVEGAAAGASADFTGTNNFETLDRIVSADSEEDQLGGTYADWYDPWDTLDRDSLTKYDATVVSASGTIGTNDVLTNTVILEFLRKIRKAGGQDPNVLVGSHEVYSEIQEIYSPQVRYPIGESIIQIDVNGVQTFNGQGVGLHVSSLYGIPFIPSKDAPSYSSDTNEVGRLFAFDTSDHDGFGYPRLGIMIAVPTVYNEATHNTQGWPFTLSKFVEKGLYWTMGETICRRFNGQGKIRDIKL